MQTEIVTSFYDQRRLPHWLTALDLINQNKVATWDWPWYFSSAVQSMQCIFPCKNLISNIEFGQDDTHCLGEATPEAITSYSIDFSTYSIHYPDNSLGI